MSQTIVTAFIRPVSSSPDGEPNTEPLPHSNTLNVAPLVSCSLCWRHADFHYLHPLLETLHLCKMCQRLLTPLGFLALMRRDMPGDETKHAQVWIARHTREASA